MFSASKTGSSVCYIPSGKKLTKSLRTRASASAYLNRTPATGNQKTWTYSLWVKRGQLTSSGVLLQAFNSGGNYFWFLMGGGGDIYIQQNPGSTIEFSTSALYVDPSSWYHIVLSMDTTQAVSTNRFNLYVNGLQVTSFTTATYPSQNLNTFVNANIVHNIGTNLGVGPTYNTFFDGYLAEVNFIDGQQLPASSFGQFDPVTGVWQPISYTGTYGTNGFYLPFTDTSSVAALGTDFSGNGNTWTVNNISLTAGSTYDSMTDVPTLTSPTAANYAVMNPLQNTYGSTFSNGNLTVVTPSANGGIVFSSIAMSASKYYWEVTFSSGVGSDIGIFKTDSTLSSSYLLQQAFGYSYTNDGQKQNNNTGTAYGAAYTVNDVIGVAFDAGNGTLTFYKNGISQGIAFTGLTNGPYSAAFADTRGDSGSTFNINFGQQPFQYTPPTGFLPLNAYNLACPTIPNGADYFTPTLYTGNGTGQSIINTGFYPDLVWTKNRSIAYNNELIDSVRGAQQNILSNSVAAEATFDSVTAFNSNGFTVGTDLGSNQNGTPIVAWQWNAASGSSVTNTAGSITSTVSANPTAGFSVVTYTGTGANATVGHGLGIAPSMVITKRRNGVSNWAVYHVSIGATAALRLDLTNVVDTTAAYWNNTAPTSSVFSVGTANDSNASTNTYVAYCWSQIPGFSAFGSYTGNGSANGPFVYTGFRPAFVLIKNINQATDWYIWDSARIGFNTFNAELYPNSSAAEGPANGGGRPMSILSNGFNILNSNGGVNASGINYIYAAFAENPFRYALAR